MADNLTTSLTTLGLTNITMDMTITARMGQVIMATRYKKSVAFLPFNFWLKLYFFRNGQKFSTIESMLVRWGCVLVVVLLPS